MCNLLLYSRLESVLVFSLGWGSSERGNVNVLFWASLYLPFFEGWLLLYYIASLQVFKTAQAGMNGYQNLFFVKSMGEKARLGSGVGKHSGDKIFDPKNK